MFGISYGELFLILGATSVLIGTKDLPVIARATGRLVGRAIAYVQLARGQLDSVLQQSQASQVHKELQETKAQLEVVLHEIRSISYLNSGPLPRRMDPGAPIVNNNIDVDEQLNQEHKPLVSLSKDSCSSNAVSSTIHSQALAYARLAEAKTQKASHTGIENVEVGRIGLQTVLPVSAESAGLLPKRLDNQKGSDIVLEAVLEAEVARNAQLFFSQPENQIPKD